MMKPTAFFLLACGSLGMPICDANTLSEPVAADTFFAAVAAQCGKAFAGRIVANEPATTAPDPFEGETLIMHVRECDQNELRIPFHVGTDRSRTWILTRTSEGLRLKHDHRLETGAPDPVTMYGGDTTAPGTEIRQVFPVDEASIALFTRQEMTVSNGNVWALEMEPAQRFVYELSRPGSNRLFRVEFDLRTPVIAPPPPWGRP